MVCIRKCLLSIINSAVRDRLCHLNLAYNRSVGHGFCFESVLYYHDTENYNSVKTSSHTIRHVNTWTKSCDIVIALPVIDAGAGLRKVSAKAGPMQGMTASGLASSCMTPQKGIQMAKKNKGPIQKERIVSKFSS